MKLAKRLARLEAEIARQEEKRQALVAEHLALSAAFIAFMPLISAFSTAQYGAVKSQALDQLSNEFLLAGYSADQAGETIEALEALFCALSVAHGAKDQWPARLS